MVKRVVRRPVLAICWAVNLLALILLAIFGRGLARWFDSAVGNTGIMVILGSLIGLLILISAYLLVKQIGWTRLVHLGWILMVLVPFMYYVARNPERWLHIPLFGMLGLLSARVFSLRTGAELSLAYAFGDELLQLYLPKRHGSFEDVLINAFCASVGVFLCWMVWDTEDSDGRESNR